ncbi:potassium transporter TrkG [Neisseriaceae bacterium ESL0693]|nr:potassium transporter TrkG [Neisseriaceae bacterium ESL0693]
MFRFFPKNKETSILYKIAPIIHTAAKTGFLFSLLLLIPTLVSFLYLDSVFHAFAYTAFITILSCAIIWLLTIRYNRELRARDSFTLVVVLWLGFALVACLPFYFYLPGLSFTDAYFEAISGLTTTGATVLTGLDTLAPSLNFWRHMLNWLGGMGIIVLAVAVLPMLGVGGTQLFKAEIPGLNQNNRIAPRISETAKLLWGIYVLFTLVTLLALKLAGMSWFDAICHSMSAFSLGGFSTHDANIAYFNSVPIEMILSVATIMGAINFTNHFIALRQHTLRQYWRDEEVQVMILTLLVSIIAISLYLWWKNYYPFGAAFRYTSFNLISIALANGYTNDDFGKWPILASLWMFFLANILSNGGSAGGGIKTIRAIVLYKFSLREMILMLHPNAVYMVKVNGNSISARIALTVATFIFVYSITVVFFTFALMISGLDFITAFSAAISCITNTGPGLGSLGPSNTYASLNFIQKWLCIMIMLLGRLELFTIFILFTPAYWRK